MQNFQILIVSAVKICKQYLQTDLSSGGFRPWTHWGSPQTSWAVAPKRKLLALPLHTVIICEPIPECDWISASILLMFFVFIRLIWFTSHVMLHTSPTRIFLSISITAVGMDHHEWWRSVRLVFSKVSTLNSCIFGTGTTVRLNS